MTIFPGADDPEFLRAYKEERQIDPATYIDLVVSSLRQDLGFVTGCIQILEWDQNIMQQAINTPSPALQTIEGFTQALREIVTHQYELLKEINRAAQELRDKSP